MIGSNPTEPASKLTLYYHQPSIVNNTVRFATDNRKKRRRTIKKGKGDNNNNISKPDLLIYVYALKSSKARRQYPKTLRMLFGFLGLPGTIQEQVQ
jgi:predicted helicase